MGLICDDHIQINSSLIPGRGNPLQAFMGYIHNKERDGETAHKQKASDVVFLRVYTFTFALPIALRACDCSCWVM